MAAKLAPPLVQHRRPLLTGWALALAAGFAIVGCRPGPPQAENISPEPTTPADSAAEPGPRPSPTSPAVTPTAPTSAAAALPDTLIGEWQPLSNVLLAFGPMTLTPDQVQWGSGQSSSYTLVSTEGGYLLELAANPSFYDTRNRYIKLIPKADANTADSIEVAFYPDATQLQNNEYIMYGGYFAE
ncbi:hypothetical protein PGN35_028860 [Nodosilinea sp. PGN35]|uniref:hypothetical protein n=1 Tax=Nodosilinea sp. PGN35 TaxID=3020489 RepID=UPI0023B20D42|nr:hypothetical protein [Nodosilinea sp. TSF1-S3]MDF0365452.1 hypothetical protein [Nodosilinea sp. TSF1-S3]